MKIFVVGTQANAFHGLDAIREAYLVDEKHETDNIDELNPWFSECVCLYHIWKNVKEDVVGLEHYRTSFWDPERNYILHEDKINELLKNNDIICGGFKFPWSGRQKLYDDINFNIKNTVPDILQLIDAKNKDFGNKVRTYLNGQKLWSCNMFIGKKYIVDEWMEFIMPIIEQYNEKYPRNENNRRREGYIFEFLFGAWLEYKNYKIVSNPIVKFTKRLATVEMIMRSNNDPILLNRNIFK